MVTGLLAALVLLAVDPPQVTARLVTGPEADSNSRREISGQVPQPDVLWRSQASVALSHTEGIHRLTVDGQWGAKVFATQHTEDLLVAETRFRWDMRPFPILGVFAELGGRDRRQRSGARSYTTSSADVGVSVGPLGPVTLLWGMGPRSFVFWPVRGVTGCDGDRWCVESLGSIEQWDLLVPKESLLRFSNVGAGTFAALLVQLTGVEVLSLTSGVDGRYFPLGLRAAAVEDGARVFDERGRARTTAQWLGQLRTPVRRMDGSIFGEVTVESVRVLYLRASARVIGNTSTSRGEQYLRGRLGLTAGGLLPGGVRLLVEGQVQATRWPEGLGLGERLALQEGDESQSSLSAQLSVPLRSGLWVEGRTAAYAAEFSTARTPFLRLVAFVGMGWRW